ncbi:hypothetical protein BaRGS_00023683 [Batillaria attramentaria]|uniref:Uncharacterized protein n=1 Tax=Batillaria attramentaria TaxID=370345 RepID=A0ABD0KCZ5_9CAEN
MNDHSCVIAEEAVQCSLSGSLGCENVCGSAKPLDVLSSSLSVARMDNERSQLCHRRRSSSLSGSLDCENVCGSAKPLDVLSSSLSVAGMRDT